MEWTCTECGNSVVATDQSLITCMGWVITESPRGVCPPCVKKKGFDQRGQIIKRARLLRAGAAEMRKEAARQVSEASAYRIPRRS